MNVLSAALVGRVVAELLGTVDAEHADELLLVRPRYKQGHKRTDSDENEYD